MRVGSGRNPGSSMLRRFLAVLSVLGLFGSPTEASTRLNVERDRIALEARVEAVRQSMRDAGAIPDADAGRPERMAQWWNWGNWGNWNNWPNWFNR
jgi:hypothetical protein